MATSAELKTENESLRAELESLRQRLGIGGRPVPRPPSFGVSEGTALELEQRGTATDPYTGGKLTELPAELAGRRARVADAAVRAEG